MKIWTKAFWKDASERVGSTFFQVLGGALIAGGINFRSFGEWSFWEPILWTVVLVLVKVTGAGFINPNTGASLGTTNPVDIVKAIVTQKDIKIDGDRIGMGMPDEVVAEAGDTVAGKAAYQDDNTPVDVRTAEPPVANPPA